MVLDTLAYLRLLQRAPLQDLDHAFVLILRTEFVFQGGLARSIIGILRPVPTLERFTGQRPL